VAEGVARDYDFEPTWITVDTMSKGIMEVFLPEVQKRGIAASETAVLANRWTSLPPIARALVAQGVPTSGPGARPYRRATHVVAPLVEELAAYATSPVADNFVFVRRELRRLIQTATGDARRDPGFAGVVAAVSLARSLGSIDGSELAADFLQQFAKAIKSELEARKLVGLAEAEILEASAIAMIADIAEHEQQLGLSKATVANLGLFGKGGKSIRLLTMHSSKGREFDAVAVVDVFDGHIPFFKAKPGDEIEAEGKRLLYVSITRPRKILMLFTLAKPTDRTNHSRFLKAMFPEGPSKPPT
jgi:DNA helicase II / ATP-dependent DNA helicase PcrA